MRDGELGRLPFHHARVPGLAGHVLPDAGAERTEPSVLPIAGFDSVTDEGDEDAETRLHLVAVGGGVEIAVARLPNKVENERSVPRSRLGLGLRIVPGLDIDALENPLPGRARRHTGIECLVGRGVEETRRIESWHFDTFSCRFSGYSRKSR